jgi:hypothetical protein
MGCGSTGCSTAVFATNACLRPSHSVRRVDACAVHAMGQSPPPPFALCWSHARALLDLAPTEAQDPATLLHTLGRAASIIMLVTKAGEHVATVTVPATAYAATACLTLSSSGSWDM